MAGLPNKCDPRHNGWTPWVATRNVVGVRQATREVDQVDVVEGGNRLIAAASQMSTVQEYAGATVQKLLETRQAMKAAGERVTNINNEHAAILGNKSGELTGLLAELTDQELQIVQRAMEIDHNLREYIQVAGRIRELLRDRGAALLKIANM